MVGCRGFVCHRSKQWRKQPR